MSVEDVLKTVGGDIKGAFLKLVQDGKKLKAVWDIISSAQTRAFLIQVGSDVLKAAKDAEAAAGANGFNVQLDAQVLTDAKQIWADVEAGDGILTSDLKILGLIS